MRVPPEERSKALAYYHKHIDRLRAVQRQRAKERYYRDKAAKLAKNKAYRENNPDKWKSIKAASNGKYYKRRFFFMRAIGIIARTQDTINPDALAWTLACLWHKQRGRCAYTGKPLDRTANVDHKTPLARGGDNSAENLHWTTADANWVKASMTHEEFIAICSDVAAHIQREIEKRRV